MFPRRPSGRSRPPSCSFPARALPRTTPARTWEGPVLTISDSQSCDAKIAGECALVTFTCDDRAGRGLGITIDAIETAQVVKWLEAEVRRQRRNADRHQGARRRGQAGDRRGQQERFRRGLQGAALRPIGADPSLASARQHTRRRGAADAQTQPGSDRRESFRRWSNSPNAAHAGSRAGTSRCRLAGRSSRRHWGRWISRVAPPSGRRVESRGHSVSAAWQSGDNVDSLRLEALLLRRLPSGTPVQIGLEAAAFRTPGGAPVLRTWSRERGPAVP